MPRWPAAPGRRTKCAACRATHRPPASASTRPNPPGHLPAEAPRPHRNPAVAGFSFCETPCAGASLYIVDTVRRCLAILLAACASFAWAAPADSDSAAGLRAKYDEFQDKLAHNAYGPPLHLVSREGSNEVCALAMQTYLGTVGSSKVGFTVVGREGDGSAKYVGGMLGATERNTMRYFLAIESYLASLEAPPGRQVEKRLNDWFAATEKYPRQLHEMDRGEYVAMKQRETQRLRAAL